MKVSGFNNSAVTQGVYAVFDEKAEVYGPPYLDSADGTAVRKFLEALIAEIDGQPSGLYAKFPADYTLFRIGTYDPGDGVFESLEAKKNLGNGVELLAQFNNHN
jgi:hypothetical protein